MQIKVQKQQIPWAMAAGRALLGPVLVAGELSGWSGPMMAWLVVSALVSDIFDGILARRWRCDTAGLRLLDSMADTVFYVCAAIALWIGQPQVLRANAALLVALLTLEATRFSIEFAKFGKPASYHSYLAKSWGLVLAIALVGVFALQHTNPLLPVALAMGIGCNLEGLAMSLALPVWRRDVKTLRAALSLRRELCGARPTGSLFALKGFFAVLGAGLFALSLAARPAFAIEPGHAAYSGGTAGVATDTSGTLDTTSPAMLIFRYNQPNGSPGQIAIDYTKIRSIESRHDVVRHLGFLPALTVGLVAARQRHYTLSITYADSADVMQVAIFEVAQREQTTLQRIVKARAPQSCTVTEFSNSCAVRPVTVNSVTPVVK